mmetsp:Transcript_56866/g.149348  ORF Transcript_56866/g.149348 Transcript_56866/m.149348 type:complete len:205 (+) Transcript_56866:412-1026(+)
MQPAGQLGGYRLVEDELVRSVPLLAEAHADRVEVGDEDSHVSDDVGGREQRARENDTGEEKLWHRIHCCDGPEPSQGGDGPPHTITVRERKHIRVDDGAEEASAKVRHHKECIGKDHELARRETRIAHRVERGVGASVDVVVAQEGQLDASHEHWESDPTILIARGGACKYWTHGKEVDVKRRATKVAPADEAATRDEGEPLIV